MNNTTIEEFSNTGTKFETSALIVLIIVIVGVIGNLLNLIALPFAKYRKKHDFHKTWMSNYVFIWNLSAIDLLGSINMTIIYIQFVFDPLAINTPFKCITLIATRDILVLTEGGAIASIAILRMLGITKSVAWLNFCDKTSNVIFILLQPWCLGSLVYVGKFILINDALSNASGETLDCGIFFYTLNSSPFTLYFEFCAHSAVFIIILACSVRIIIYIRATSKALENKRNVVQKGCGSNTTRIVFGVCFVYILQCAPYMLVRGLFVDSMRSGFFIQFAIPFRICYILYYTQFALNIFIYAIGKKEFRNAYKDLLIEVFRCFRKTNRESDTNNSSRGSPRLNIIDRANNVDLQDAIDL